MTDFFLINAFINFWKVVSFLLTKDCNNIDISIDFFTRDDLYKFPYGRSTDNYPNYITTCNHSDLSGRHKWVPVAKPYSFNPGNNITVISSTFIHKKVFFYIAFCFHHLLFSLHRRCLINKCVCFSSYINLNKSLVYYSLVFNYSFDINLGKENKILQVSRLCFYLWI